MTVDNDSRWTEIIATVVPVCDRDGQVLQTKSGVQSCRIVKTDFGIKTRNVFYDIKAKLEQKHVWHQLDNSQYELLSKEATVDLSDLF